MGTVSQDMPQINSDSPPRWDRFECTDLLEQYRALRDQGISERQAAKALKVPRSTQQAWRLWHDSLDLCPNVADFFQSGPALAFLHHIVIAFPLVCVEIGACSIRLVVIGGPAEISEASSRSQEKAAGANTLSKRKPRLDRQASCTKMTMLKRRAL